MRHLTPLALLVLPLALGAPLPAASDVAVHWLETPPSAPAGVSFGIPWPRGQVARGQTFGIVGSDGHGLPTQTWTLAYWPDGSIKWTGFATVAQGPGPFTVTSNPAPASASGPSVSVRRSETGMTIDTGALKVRIPNEGENLIDWMEVGGRIVARNGQLVCILQDGPDDNTETSPTRERYLGKLEKVTLEQSGPVRAVVKLEGRHRSVDGDREWLPFVVRLYFYAGERTVRVVHTIIFDGDQNRDFIHGLGIEFGVPMREEVQNRHVRFSGEGEGLWDEAVQPLVGRQGHAVFDPARKAPPPSADSPYPGARRRSGVDVFPDQVAGLRVPNRDQVDASSQNLMSDWAVWDDYKLVQPNADGFTIIKRTNPQSTWLAAGAGRRASGLVFAGDVSGGLGISIRNFWQSFPASLEVRHAASPEAQVIAWLWSPDAPSMDLRHYDTKAHGLDAVYEDVQPGFSTATGVARTSEMTLFATPDVPSRAEAVAEASVGRLPPFLVTTPETIHAAGVFGEWSPVDRSTPTLSLVQDQLDAAIALYEKEVEQRHWYGFWYYGNVMHSYDEVRHVWRYDLGGMAWDNTELGSDMWLWYSFLRSGRADIFRMAEAETRDTSEIDVYHLGRFAGLGSRHNVVPWGCGAKEARISQAAWKRFYYYLSTDERVGDLMHEVVNADAKAVEFDPMRLAQPITARERQYPGRVRGGPDWLAFIGNWMTEWERTGDTRLARQDLRRDERPCGDALRVSLRPQPGLRLRSEDRRPLPGLGRARRLQPGDDPGRSAGGLRAEHARRQPGLRVGNVFKTKRDFGNQNDIASAGDSRVNGNPAGIAAHHFEDHDAVVARRRRMQPVQRVGRTHHRQIEAKGHGGGVEIIVDGLRHPDDGNAVFAQLLRDGQRSVPAHADER